jgi:hypothetical protein
VADEKDPAIGREGLFTEAPEPVRRYFRERESRESFHWTELAPQEHAKAFTVAKTLGYDVLADIRAAVDDAVVNRRTFEEFRAGLEPLLRAKGWWGKAIQVDPLTGEAVEVLLGSPRRLRTIYWANVYAAHAAGEWDRIQESKRVLPFLLYVRTTAKEPREEHEAWVGTVLPVDHPWWDTHFPPNGWGCKCSVEQISRSRARTLGYDPDRPPPALKLKPWANRRTGETVMVPDGIDPGWQGNPGKTRAKLAADLAAGRIDAMPPAAQQTAAADLAASPLARAITGGVVPYRRGDDTPANKEAGRIAVPIAALPAALSTAIGAATQVVRLSVADAAKMVAHHPEIAVADLGRLQAAAAAPTTRRVLERDRGQLHLTWADAGGFWHAVVRRAAAGRSLFLKTLHRFDNDPGYADRIRRRGDEV